MKLRSRSLYVTIFLWFCLTIFVSTSLVLLVTSLTGSRPFGRRWMAMSQDLYAHSAVDFYTTGGAPALSRYLAVIETNSGIEGHLIDARGEDVLGGGVPVHTTGTYREAQNTGHSAARLGRYWTAASPVSGPGGGYIFVMEAHPLHGFIDGTFFNSIMPRLLGGMLLVALFCLLLARHITRPIRMLEGAATRMAAGDLSVRTLPAMHGRADELAAMGAAFDSMAERIETLLRTQRQMLADISHELRSPLTRISVSLELLRRGEVDVLEPMQTDLDRLNEMIGQVLELTRLELSEPLEPSAQHEVSLSSIVEDIVESANYEGRARGMKVTLALAGSYFVTGEHSALRSCIENIVRNALQHSEDGGEISVAIDPSPNVSVVVRVEDSGPGVPDEALPRLFAPFYRVPASMAAHPGGSGLGLSIAARVAARCGGSIMAHNRIPHGLSVSVTLPRCLHGSHQLS
jgi:two-component system sensor histidine kinase CpxA